MGKQLETGLAWLWVLCAVLTVLDMTSPLQFADRAIASGAHWAVWLLAFSATRHFHWFAPLPYLLWSAVLGVGLLWVASFFVGILGLFTQLPGQYVYSFFMDSGGQGLLRWEMNYVDFRRNRALIASQVFTPLPGMGSPSADDYRTVHIWPLTPLLQWVRETDGPNDSAALVRQGWAPVGRFYTDFSFDPAEQRRLDAALAQREAQTLRDHQAYEASPEGQAEAARQREDEASSVRDSAAD